MKSLKVLSRITSSIHFNIGINVAIPFIGVFVLLAFSNPGKPEAQATLQLGKPYRWDAVHQYWTTDIPVAKTSQIIVSESVLEQDYTEEHTSYVP